MKKRFILRVLAFAAIALAGVSHESTAQDSDSLFVEGGGSGTGGGRMERVEVDFYRKMDFDLSEFYNTFGKRELNRLENNVGKL